jgi:hypothetical protein
MVKVYVVCGLEWFTILFVVELPFLRQNSKEAQSASLDAL